RYPRAAELDPHASPGSPAAEWFADAAVTWPVPLLELLRTHPGTPPYVVAEVLMQALHPLPVPLRWQGGAPYDVVFPVSVRDAWVAALRGEDYEQGLRYLYHDGGWCCLGVLADQHRSSGMRLTSDVGFTWRCGPSAATLLPPGFLAELAGAGAEAGDVAVHLRHADADLLVSLSLSGHLNCLNETTTLTTLNDAEVPFPMIADVIEQCLPVVGVGSCGLS
ncbi:MAG: hypothetical protein ACRDSN_03190, partial [Pseudonocardiaceae bacterium]